MNNIIATDSESGTSSVGKNSFTSEDKLKSSEFRCRITFVRSNLWLWILILLCLIFILISILIGFLISSIRNQQQLQQQQISSLCLNVDCITAAAEMLNSMNPQVDPCQDFYEYSCGGWIRTNSMSDDESRADTYSVIRNQMSEKLKLLLEEPIKDNEDSDAIKKVKNFYISCVDMKTIEQRAEQPLLQLLDLEFGGWSLIRRETDKLSKMDWVTMMGILRQYNNEIIIGHNVGPHDANSSLYSIKIYPGGLGMSSGDFYFNKTSKNYQSYRNLILRTIHLLLQTSLTISTPSIPTTMTTTIGTTSSLPLLNNVTTTTTIEQDVDDLLEFETKLANISLTFEKTGGAAYQRMPLSKLSKLVPKINWQKYFELTIPIPFNETESIGIFGFDYFLDVQDIVEQVPEKIIKNYLLWRFVMNRIKNLDSRFENILEDYYRDQYGTKSVPARWKKCIDFVNGNLGTAVSALYVRKYFDLESKQKAEEMILNIKKEFMLILDEVEWMDDETRNDAKKKAEMMEEHIGFPDYILDPVLLDKDFEHLDFKNDTYFENVVGYLKNSTKKSQSKLSSVDDRTKWTVMPSVVNAQYHRFRNLMSFPAAILQSPFFNKNYPASLNYGAIGSVIGHELTHGFDSNGRHHDQFGNQRLWWHPNTVDRFIKKSSCMIMQYNNYTVHINGETLNANGLLTLGENIADNGGVKQSYRAFKRSQNNLKNQNNFNGNFLPGLNMTHEQLFFLKFAQSWCQIMTEEGVVEALKTWRHSLGKFRVIGTLSNFEEFSNAFSCPVGTPMNPKEKCNVW